MLTSKKRAAKRGCWTEGIASRAYQYRRAKTNFKWIHQLKSGPCKSTTERRMVSYTLLLLRIHPYPNLFPITLSGKGLSGRPAAAWMSVHSAHSIHCPLHPGHALHIGSTADWRMALVLCITGLGCRGATVKGGREEHQVCQSSLLQANDSEEWRGGVIALGRVAGSFTWWYWNNLLH